MYHPVGAVPELPKLHAAIKRAFDDWRAYLAARLGDQGWRPAAALALAQTIVASIEGAMILARIDQDERTLAAVADTLARVVAAGDRPDGGRRAGQPRPRARGSSR